ncbi:TPA: hypothetical protein RFV74_002344 [Klebsiella aerogenes]|nr:hypothetical protein [Klebsiella aerogenes]
MTDISRFSQWLKHIENTDRDALPEDVFYRLKQWDEAKARRDADFVRTRLWTGNGSVNIFRIVGTDRPDAVGRNWRGLCNNAPRMADCLRLADESPEFYTDPTITHSDMQFVSRDGADWYLRGDGINRCCAARYYFLFCHSQGRPIQQLHNVTQELVLHDEVLLQCVRSLEALIPQLATVFDIKLRTERVREDCCSGPGWRQENFRTAIHLRISDSMGTYDYTLESTEEVDQHYLRMSRLLEDIKQVKYQESQLAERIYRKLSRSERKVWIYE